jgi:hypothetical protein
MQKASQNHPNDPTIIDNENSMSQAGLVTFRKFEETPKKR